MEKRKRKELNFKDKVSLIRESSGKSQRQLAERFGIGKTQVQTILKRKAEIMEEYDNNTSSNDRKRLCKRSPVEELNMGMWDWFQKMMKQGLRVSGPMIQEKALMFARELQIPETEFKASKGWLNRFRDRHNISFQKVCGESGSVAPETVQEWQHKLPELMNGFRKEDIYNMDETGLYFRAMPDRTLCVRGEDVKGGKKSKDRITVMLCVNMTGEFEKPLVIGKARKPRCFRNIKPENLPVTWQWNRKAWMTTEIFMSWITEFNRKMKHQQRHVLLFLDNATSHPDNLDLSNVKVQFLPKNTTSVLQPLDQGILQNLKVHYRKRLIRSVITKIDNEEGESAETLSKSITVLNAIHFLKASVNDIKKETVERCFVKAGFKVSEGGEEVEEFEDDNIPLAELADLIRKAESRITTGSKLMAVNEYVELDNEVPVHEELSSQWEDDIISRVRTEMTEDRTEGNDGDDAAAADDDDSGEECNIRTHQEALKCIEHLKLYCFSKDMGKVSELLQYAQDAIEKETVKALSTSKQTTIDTFFK